MKELLNWVLRKLAVLIFFVGGEKGYYPSITPDPKPGQVEFVSDPCK